MGCWSTVSELVGQAPLGRAERSLCEALPQFIELLSVEDERTRERIVTRLLDKPRSNRVGQNVSSHSQHGFVITQDMFVIALLPQRLILSATIAIGSSLFDLVSERDEI